MEEVWKDVVGFEGLYKVSNKGRVWNVKRARYQKLTQANKGYLQCTLTKNKKTVKGRIHRLVAEAFIGGTGETVNHKDFDVTNNCVENLEWMSFEENLLHAGRKCINGVLGIGVVDGNVIAFDSYSEARRYGYRQAERRVKTNSSEPYKGYVWKLV